MITSLLLIAPWILTAKYILTDLEIANKEKDTNVRNIKSRISISNT